MLSFKKIRYKNLLSFGDQFTEIQLDRSPSTLITGENGAGKSTFLDALTFVLYNKPFRKINKPQLVNSVNGKNLVVEIEFMVGTKCFMVRRGIKPNIFEIYEHSSFDDIEEHLLPQNAAVTDYQSTLEKDILKMNYQAFTQIVILGKATFVPFMRLTAGDRRQVIEDLLGLRIFGVMNAILREKQKTLKSNLESVETNVMMCEDKISTRQKFIDDMTADRVTQITEAESKIAELEGTVAKATADSEKLAAAREDLAEKVAEESKLMGKRRKLDGVKAQLKTKIGSHQEVLDFFDENTDCPTCGQHIEDDFRAPIIADRNSKIEKLNSGLTKAVDDITELQEQLDEMDVVNGRISKIDRKISEFNSTIREQTRQIKELNARVTKLNGVNTEKDQAVVDELKEDLEELRAKRNELQETSSYYLGIGAMLKDDGIKTLIIDKYLPVFNNLINTYLQKMGFIVKFTLDDQFNEQILSRHRDKFSYNNFSEGQKLRIDLAILLTWREVAKLKNSLNTNLLIMDEVFDSSLDQEGVDAFMDILPSMGDSNIFVVSHTPDKLYDKFRSHINFTMVQNFSNMNTTTV